jgi:hypothetical protein
MVALQAAFTIAITDSLRTTILRQQSAYPDTLTAPHRPTATWRRIVSYRHSRPPTAVPQPCIKMTFLEGLLTSAIRAGVFPMHCIGGNGTVPASRSDSRLTVRPASGHAFLPYDRLACRHVCKPACLLRTWPAILLAHFTANTMASHRAVMLSCRRAFCLNRILSMQAPFHASNLT